MPMTVSKILEVIENNYRASIYVLWRVSFRGMADTEFSVDI
jgi:hypothetical protein